MLSKEHSLWIVPMILFAALLAIILLSGPGRAEGSIVFIDHAGDAEAYRKAVAELQRPDQKKLRATRKHLVLLRTDGTIPNLDKYGVQVLVRGQRDRYTASFATAEEAIACVHWLEAQNWVVYAEENQHMYVAAEDLSIDYMSHGAFEMGFSALTDFVRKASDRGAVVAVIDSGVYRHKRLVDRFATLGFDYVDVDRDPTNDGHGHGTLIAGIIADCSQETDIGLMPIRVLDNSGYGSTANIANAIIEAVAAHVDVINLSLTVSGHSDAIDDAIREAISSGVIVVVAAGNDASSTDYVCPAHMTEEGVIVTGAIENVDGLPTRATYSNYGSSVDISAPGTAIRSCSNDGGTMTMSGTSMAAAHISAAVAELRIICGDTSPSEAEHWVKALVVRNAEDIPGIPNLALAVPALSYPVPGEVVLGKGISLQLDAPFLPDGVPYSVEWSSDVASIVTVSEDGALSCLAAGNATLCARCIGMEIIHFQIEVVDLDKMLFLPSSLQKIGTEALSGLHNVRVCCFPEEMKCVGERVFLDCEALCSVWMPDSIVEIADDAFEGAEKTVIVCRRGSLADKFAEAHDLQRLLIL